MILIVEDEVRWRELIRRQFSTLNLERMIVQEATNYNDAINRIDVITYDAYILDSHFPRSPSRPPRYYQPVEYLGLELARQIRNRGILHDRIAILSDNSNALQDAKKECIQKIYHKKESDKEAGEKHWGLLAHDLATDFKWKKK